MTPRSRLAGTALLALLAASPRAQDSVADVEKRVATLLAGEPDPALVGLWQLRAKVLALDFEPDAEKELLRDIDNAVRRLDPDAPVRQRRLGKLVDRAFDAIDELVERRWPRSAVRLAEQLEPLDTPRAQRIIREHAVAGRALTRLAWSPAAAERIDDLRAEAGRWAVDDREEDAAAMLAAAIWHTNATVPLVPKEWRRASKDLRREMRGVDAASLKTLELLEDLLFEILDAADRLEQNELPQAAAAMLERARRIAPEVVSQRLLLLGGEAGNTLLGEMFGRPMFVFGPANWLVEPNLVTIPASKGDPWKDTALATAAREFAADEHVRIRADLWIGASHSGSGAIVFACRGGEDLAMFHVWHRDGYSDVRFLELKGDRFGPLKEIQHEFPAAERGDWMTMTVEIRGARVRGKLGSSPWVEAELPGTSAGRFGFYRDGGSTHPEPIRWRNLKITAIER